MMSGSFLGQDVLPQQPVPLLELRQQQQQLQQQGQQQEKESTIETETFGYKDENVFCIMCNCQDFLIIPQKNLYNYRY